MINTVTHHNSNTSHANNGCVHCDCGCHCAKRMDAMKLADVAYLDSLPIGCRFLPTDEELVVHYLRKKIKNENLPKNKIIEVNVYGYHPKDLAANYPQAIEGVWYFFSSRDRKCGRGNRPRRNAVPGYWKATGLDRVIKHNADKIGSRKLLVYYEGHQSKGTKTSWMMHEYVAEGSEEQPLGSDDKKFNDYVLCKIYKNGRMKDEVVSEDQPCVPSNDQDENLITDFDPDQNEQDDVVTEYPNQSMNIFALHHVDIHLPVLDSNQQIMSPSSGQVMVPDQQAHVVSNPDANPNYFQVNPSIHHGESQLRAKTLVKEAKSQVMVRDQQARVVSSQDINPTNLQVESNVVVQDYENSGSLYDLIMKACTRYTKRVEKTSFQPTKAPLVPKSCPTRLNQKYSLENPPTRQRSQSLPPWHRHGNPWMHMYDPSSNLPSLQVTPPALQDNDECDGRVIFERNIKLMIEKDGYDGVNFDNYYRV